MASSPRQAAPPAPAEAARLEEILSDFPGAGSSDVVPLLQAVQTRYGYLPAEALQVLAKRTRISLTQMYGVATFYAQFSFVPRGKHPVRVPRGTACHVRGGNKVQKAVQQHLGLKEGESSADLQFTFETVGCLGACALSPLITVGPDYYGKMTPKKATLVLAEYAKK